MYIDAHTHTGILSQYIITFSMTSYCADTIDLIVPDSICLDLGFMNDVHILG